MRTRGSRKIVIALALLMLAAWSAQAQADFGLVPGSFTSAPAATQAGAHADLTTTFTFNSHPDPTIFGDAPDDNAKTVIVSLPKGVSGNPQAYPQCSAAFLTANTYCPASTQVGVITYTLAGPPFILGNITAPVYNMVPQSGHVAELGVQNNALVPVQFHIVLSVRPDDYGIDATVPQLPGNLKPLTSTITIWGVPGDSSHDSMRGSIKGGGCLNDFSAPYGPTGGTCPSAVTPEPFLSNATQCNQDKVATFTADSWQNPGVFLPTLSSAPQQVTNCDSLTFEPSLTFQSQTRKVNEPSAYTADVHVPQTELPTALATPHLRNVTVQLPEGVVVSPSAGNGLEGCSDAQIGVGTDAPAQCPDGSRIGTVKVLTPLLPGPLEGSVYQGTQTPEHLLRLFIAARGFGVTVKLPGAVDLDPDTGRITSTFTDNPQLPFEHFILSFNGGPTAPLANPRSCGIKPTSATLESWAGQTAFSTDAFTISGDGNGSACPPPQFKPTFAAGVLSTTAGAGATFALTLARDDVDGEFKQLSVNLPPGLLAHIGSVDLCEEPDASRGTCGPQSQIGTVTTSAGPGPQPFFLTGKAYLTDRYAGQPFGMTIVVPAKAGPLDLGNVIVRASIAVRNDGSARVVSDTFPHILQGIPLQIRSVTVNADRDGFFVNPTNCQVMHVTGQATSLTGQISNLDAPFQVGDCARLPFAPKLTIAVGRKRHTTRGTSTPLTATLTQTPGQAGVKSVQVLLPLALNALLPVVENACTQAEFQAGKCEKARAGSAVAVTPLLKHALRGSVYFVKTAKKGALPNLIVALRGQVDIDLVGHITIPTSGQLGTDFATVPDVPIKRFTLSLVDGKHGPVGVVDNLCGAKARAQRVAVSMTGQNGARLTSSPHMQIRGCAKRGH